MAFTDKINNQPQVTQTQTNAATKPIQQVSSSTPKETEELTMLQQSTVEEARKAEEYSIDDYNENKNLLDDIEEVKDSILKDYGSDEATTSEYEKFLAEIEQTKKSIAPKIQSNKISLDDNEDNQEVLKGKVMNKDGTINTENAIEMYSNNELSFEDLATIFGAEVQYEHDSKFCPYIELPNGDLVGEYQIGMSYKDIFEDDFANLDEKVAEEIKYNGTQAELLYIESANGEYNEGYRLPDDAKKDYEQVKKEAQDKINKIDEFKTQVFNDNGSINSDKIGELFESGEISYNELENVLGVLSNRSGQLRYVGEDGTEIIGENMTWSGLTDTQYVQVTTPDGKTVTYEYKPEK